MAWVLTSRWVIPRRLRIAGTNVTSDNDTFSVIATDMVRENTLTIDPASGNVTVTATIS